MKQEHKEIIKLSAIEVIKSVAEGVSLFALPFAKNWKTKREIRAFLGERSIDRQDFSRKIYYLKRRGLIRELVEGKEKYYELTNKGIDKLKDQLVKELKVKKPNRWDKKWRSVIFDIPEDDRVLRNVIRHSLYQLGFYQIQKSVFVYPYECHGEIKIICDHFGGRKYLKYMISEIMEGEEEIIEKFIDNKVLSERDLS